MIIRSLFFLLASWLCITPAQGQDKPIYLLNPSFEGTPGPGSPGTPMIFGWRNCAPPSETPPDVHGKLKGKGDATFTHIDENGVQYKYPANTFFGVTQKPFHGKTFLGMVTRDIGTWESIGQKLETPLRPGNCYEFSLNLCRSENYISIGRQANLPINMAKPVRLQVWAGKDFCDKSELLAASPAIAHKDWVRYRFQFEVSEPLPYLTFEAYYDSPEQPYNGNLLLDNISPISVIEGCAPLQRYEFTDNLMGTQWRLVFFARSDSLARAAAGIAFWRIKTIEKIASDYLEDSEVSLLSATAGSKKWVKVSGDLWHMLWYGQVVAQKTKGAFDLSCGALTKLWRKASRQHEMPSPEEIATARRSVDYRKIQLRKKDHSVRLDLPGMRLDLGALAKGYAIDEAMKSLLLHDIPIALVEGGGDLLTGSPPPGQTGWSIALATLESGEPAVSPIHMANRAVATSGATYRFLEWEGTRYSHIIDPRTGLPLTHRRLATVTASSCLEADAWATAASVAFDEALKNWLSAQSINVHFFEEKASDALDR